MRGSSLARQQRLVRLLDQGDGLSVPRTAAELGCTERTVYRDIDHLSAAGVPVWGDRGRQGGFQLQVDVQRAVEEA